MDDASQFLAGEAEAFAARLLDLLSAVIPEEGSPLNIVVRPNPASNRVMIGPTITGTGKNPTQFDGIPLRRSVDPIDSPPPLELRLSFSLTLNDTATHMAVHSSVFGLDVGPDPQRSVRPVFRVEYVRNPKSVPAAHIHFHAESSELGWIYGTSGSALRRFDSIHFPVGGRRFRPTIEDVLIMLDREEIFTDWKTPEWRSIVEQSRDESESRQAGAAAARFPDEAAATLRRLGYTVEAPAKGTQ